jgi:hypothetical protein
VPAWLDRQHLRDVQQVAEGLHDPHRVIDHLPKGVDALHLGREQMVAGTLADSGVPGDAQVREQGEGSVADLGQQCQGGMLRWQAEVVGPTFNGALLRDVRRRALGVVRERFGALFPRDGADLLCLCVGHRSGR